MPLPGSITFKIGATFHLQNKNLGRFRELASSTMSMEKQTENKVYFHYNHTDSCSSARWTARESFNFMYERPWQDVVYFYSNVVNARFTLSTLFAYGAQVSVSFQFNSVFFLLFIYSAKFSLMILADMFPC